MNASVASINEELRSLRDYTLTALFWFMPQVSTSQEELDQAQSTWRTPQGADISSEQKLVIKVSGAVPSWLSDTTDVLNTILALKENWDSYGAQRIQPEAASAAMQVLLAVMKKNTPTPAIVPTPSGNIQLEWHQSGIDLEIEIDPDGQCYVSYEDGTGQTEPWEGALAHHPIYAPESLTHFIDELTRRTNTE